MSNVEKGNDSLTSSEGKDLTRPENTEQEELVSMADLARNSLVGMGRLNEDGSLRSANPAMQEMMQIVATQVGLEPVFVDLIGPDRKGFDDLRNGKVGSTLISEYSYGGNRLRFTIEKRVEGLYATVEDRTKERGEREDELSIARHNLLGWMSPVYAYAQMARRDVGSGMEQIISLSDRLEDMEVPQKMQGEIQNMIDRLAKVRVSTGNIVEIFEGLRKRIDSSLRVDRIGMKKVEIDALLKSFYGLARPELEKSNIKSTLDIDRGIPSMIGNEEDWVDILRILTNNAQQATDMRWGQYVNIVKSEVRKTLFDNIAAEDVQSATEGASQVLDEDKRWKSYQELLKRFQLSDNPQSRQLVGEIRAGIRERLAEVTKPERRVTYDLRHVREGSLTQLLVSDFGTGIPPEIKEKLLTGRGVTTKKGTVYDEQSVGGKGLGLYFANEKITALGGRITIVTETEKALRQKYGESHRLQTGTVIRIAVPSSRLSK